MRPATILLAALLVFPGLVLAVAPPTEPNWTYADIIVGKNGAATDSDGGTTLLGLTSINTQDGATEIWVGTPTAYTRTTISDASNACIRRGDTDSEWLVAYEDTVTDTLQFIRSTNSGTSWSSPSQVLPIVSTVLDCDIYKYPTGTIIVAVGEFTSDTVYAVRSTDNGATWETADTVQSVATSLEAIQIDNDYGIYYEENSAGTTFIYRETSSNDGQTWGSQVTAVTEANILSCGGYHLTTGDIVVVYNDFTDSRIEYARSTDGGATFTDNQLLYDYGGATSASMNAGCMDEDSTSLWVVFSINVPDQFVVANTDDGGVTWDVQVVESNPFADDDLIMAASDSDLSIYTDSGADAYLDEYYAANPNGAGSQAGGGGGGGDGEAPPVDARTVQLNKTPDINVTLDGTLWGFDLSPDGQTIITRTTDPTAAFNITTYRGTSLSKMGSTTDDEFMLHGVVAGNNNIAWVDKTATANNGIIIRARDFDPPIKPPGCSDLACPPVITDLDEKGAFPDMQGIQEISRFNPDYNYRRTATAGDDYSIIAMGFSTSDGDIGAWAKLTVDVDDDEAELEILSAAFEDSGVPTAMCAWSLLPENPDGEELDYVGAASPGSGAKVWLANVVDDVTFTTGAGINDLDLFTQVNPKFTAPPAYSNAGGIACFDREVYITDNDTFIGYNINQGYELFDPIQESLIYDRSLSINPSLNGAQGGTVIAYVNATHLVVRDPNNGGALLASGIYDGGTPFKTAIDSTGSTIFLATTSPNRIYKWDFSASTCTNYCGQAEPTTTTTTTTGTTDPVTGEVVGAGDGGRLGSPSLPGIDFASLSGVGGISASAWAWVIGFMLVLFGIAGGMVLALTVLGATPGAAVAFAMGGGALGIIGAVAFSLWPVWPLLVIILLAILAVLGMRGGSG